jgi:hypothetical protein
MQRTLAIIIAWMTAIVVLASVPAAGQSRPVTQPATTPSIMADDLTALSLEELMSIEVTSDPRPN